MEIVKNSKETVEEKKGMIHKLKKAFEYEDKTYEEIEFDFDKLTGEDFIAILHEMNANGIFVRSEYNDGRFLKIVASKASGVAADVIAAMPYKDNQAIKDMVQEYLIPKKGEESGVEMNMDALTGRDADAIETEFMNNNLILIQPALSVDYRIKIAARASGKTEKELKEMHIRKYMMMDREVRSFLLK